MSGSQEAAGQSEPPPDVLTGAFTIPAISEMGMGERETITGATPNRCAKPRDQGGRHGRRVPERTAPGGRRPGADPRAHPYREAWAGRRPWVVLSEPLIRRCETRAARPRPGIGERFVHRAKYCRPHQRPCEDGYHVKPDLGPTFLARGGCEARYLSQLLAGDNECRRFAAQCACLGRDGGRSPLHSLRTQDGQGPESSQRRPCRGSPRERRRRRDHSRLLGRRGIA